MKKCGTKRTKNQIQKWQNLSLKKKATIQLLAYAYQIRPQGGYEEQNEQKISMIYSVNDLLEQHLQN